MRDKETPALCLILGCEQAATHTRGPLKFPVCEEHSRARRSHWLPLNMSRYREFLDRALEREAEQ